jgi:hypothetical protein
LFLTIITPTLHGSLYFYTKTTQLKTRAVNTKNKNNSNINSSSEIFYETICNIIHVCDQNRFWKLLIPIYGSNGKPCKLFVTYINVKPNLFTNPYDWNINSLTSTTVRHTYYEHSTKVNGTSQKLLKTDIVRWMKNSKIWMMIQVTILWRIHYNVSDVLALQGEVVFVRYL